MDKIIVTELAAILAIYGYLSIVSTSALSLENEVVKHGTKSTYELHFIVNDYNVEINRDFKKKLFLTWKVFCHVLGWPFENWTWYINRQTALQAYKIFSDF